MSGVREMADAFHERWLATHPFAASIYGVPGYDDRVPDDSEAGEAVPAHRARADAGRGGQAGFARRCPEADAITLACLRENVGRGAAGSRRRG